MLLSVTYEELQCQYGLLKRLKLKEGIALMMGAVHTSEISVNLYKTK
jgi:transcriptional antiterminator Rof (Rho-off)